MDFSPDSVELEITKPNQAKHLIQEQMPEKIQFFSLWSDWLDQKSQHHSLNALVNDLMHIAYLRMALRNGSLSSKPRHYHNEKHIEDLVYRMMAVSEHEESSIIPDYGWCLLSLFMSAHDLRQGEDNHDSSTMVGINERASYKELLRLIDSEDPSNVFTEEYKQLLKLMIYGSTFGKSEDEHGNVFNGNLVAYLLEKVDYFEAVDKEIAFLACDIDTANVSAPLSDFANSSLDVFNEIQAFNDHPIPAQLFFGEMQENYFFTLQTYNSQLGHMTFNELKLKNAPIVKEVSRLIASLDPQNHSNKDIIDLYLTRIQNSK